MHRPRSRCRLLCLSVACALGAAMSAPAAEVTIYRCTDAQGKLTLRDTPCRKGERQQTRAMLRPRDPPPRTTARPVSGPAPAAYPAPPRLVVVQAPRQMYECVNEDGQRYLSDDADGNPRWVPLAILGYPAFPGPFVHADAGFRGRLEYRNDRMRGRVDFGDRRPPLPPLLPIGGSVGYPAGTWIRDNCYALPQAEVCGRLRDQRYELDRRYNSALQSERTQITQEQRGIDARLSNDCGAY